MRTDENASALIGAVLDQHWRLTRLIGSGGLGLVFEAESLRGEEAVAVKILREQFRDEPEIVDRFLTEATASARIDHPGVAKVFVAARAADQTPYLVMELLRGQPLTTRMNQGRLPVEQAAPIAHNLLLALAAAHAAGVVHRDLKPDNVFLVRDAAGNVEVKVVDFGLARVMDAVHEAARRTRTGMMLGTPGYMSPEQICDVKAADARADLWSVGIIFYEMLTGVPAFEAENEFARITKVLSADPTPIAQVAPQYAHWTPFFAKALARDVNERFQSATEMAEALKTVARSGQMPVSPLSFDAIPASALMPSAPPPASAAAARLASTDPLTLPRFGHGDTAISAGAPPSAGQASISSAVRVVSPSERGVRVSLVWTLALAVLALGAGFIAGLTAGHW
jgi:eukaryotic-like serine/threonine-protein kinase